MGFRVTADTQRCVGSAWPRVAPGDEAAPGYAAAARGHAAAPGAALTGGAGLHPSFILPGL